MCQVLRGQSSDKYRFWQCQGEHTGVSSWLGPHGFPFPVGVVMLVGFPIRLDPSALFVVLVVAAMGLPTRWGPTALVAVFI